MRRAFLIVCVCVVAVLTSTFTVAARTHAAPLPALKSVHLFTPPDSMNETRILALLAESNGVMRRIGYPNASYRLWKLSSKQTGAPTYMVEGVWPSQAAYDSIHTHELWTASGKKLDAAYTAMYGTQVYYRYVQVP
jgi:hypothetical protein